ncbi:MAG: pseudouridine synthase [Moraxella sp.]|nr:pseudouridine synthase [Moraxella sp.]
MFTPPAFIPPMKQGVSASKLYLPKLADDEAVRFDSLLSYLCHVFSHIKQSEWRYRFVNGLVLDDIGNALSLDTPYLSNRTIYYYRFVADEIHIPFYHTIIFENENILVVDKPHFLTVSPAGDYVRQTLLSRLKAEYNNAELTPLHRLDKDTAGLILFSKNKKSRDNYQALFRTHAIKKTYHAIAKMTDGVLPSELSLCMTRSEPFYTMQVTDSIANTHTKIELMEHNQHWAKYQLTPTTGKLHQLRVHMNYLNIPIKNDPYYPVVQHRQKDDFSSPLQLLAKSLFFIDPVTHELLSFQSSRALILPDE